MEINSKRLKMYNSLRLTVCLISLTCLLQASIPDISNMNNCIYDVRKAALNPPSVPTFDQYLQNYQALLSDLETAKSNLPYVYQEAAAKPLISFLENLGEERYLQIFNSSASDVLQEIIPDAALAVLEYDGTITHGINAFQEIVSDLYDGFLNEEERAGNESGTPIEPPTYGVIPPLVKFGNEDFGPYTWPADATNYLLGMGCGLVSLPPSQMQGGVIAWSTLGHETGGHDITHADEGLLDELAHIIYRVIFQSFRSKALANYWANCVDEATADVCGYLNMGPSLGAALIGYFRALGDGKLRTVAYINDTHPIDLLRGYLAAASIKRLNFKDANAWSQAIANETRKDNGTLYFVDRFGNYSRFPVSLDIAIASTDLVAQVIMKAKLSALQGHSLQELVDWKDQDQTIADTLANILRNGEDLPIALQGPGFYAAHVVAGATQAGFQKGTKLYSVFSKMRSFLEIMHLQNPTWSKENTEESIALLQLMRKAPETHDGKHIVRQEVPERALALN